MSALISYLLQIGLPAPLIPVVVFFGATLLLFAAMFLAAAFSEWRNHA